LGVADKEVVSVFVRFDAPASPMGCNSAGPNTDNTRCGFGGAAAQDRFIAERFGDSVGALTELAEVGGFAALAINIDVYDQFALVLMASANR
jgi:hypothetical protein